MFPNKPQFPRRLPLPGVLLALAVLTGVWSIWVFAWPVVRVEEPADHPGHFGLVYAHALGGIAILAVGSAALFLGWTKRQFRWHRALGRVYLIVGGAGALAGVVLSVANTHADPALPFAVDLVAVSETGWALATQGVAWMLFAAMAYRAARNRRFDAHRDWMVRGYVVAWGFVVGALADRVPVLAELGDGAAIRWLMWVAPLLVSEVALQWRETGPRRVPKPTATAPIGAGTAVHDTPPA